MNIYFGLVLALGVFLANWLVVPLFFLSRTHKDGFFIGVIAAAIVMILCKVFLK
jgi:hypothetical protein